MRILLGLLGQVGKPVLITPPFWCDYGYNDPKTAAAAATRIICAYALTRMVLRTLNHAKFRRACPPKFCCSRFAASWYNISVGDYFYSNHNLVVTDGAQVACGNHVFIVPNCCFTTAEHAIDPEQRKGGLEVAKPITIGNNVWIGAGTTVLADVTIGDDSVIGAGRVVSRYIPKCVVAAGVPCRVLREITAEDKTVIRFIKARRNRTFGRMIKGALPDAIWQRAFLCIPNFTVYLHMQLPARNNSP